MTKFYYFLSTEQFQPEVLVEHAVLAEKAGFDGVMISEHFHPWVDDVAANGNAFTILGGIAEKTSKVKLATGVVAPLFRYHPGVLAQHAATIDRLSDGRFELGVGTGRDHDEGPLGFNFPAYKERAERLREEIEIVRRMLDGEELTYKGKYYQTKDAKLYSTPKGKVPIYMAAGGPKSAILAAEVTDGLITSIKDPKWTIDNLIKPAKKVNKDLKLIATRWTVYAQNEEDAWEALKAQRGLRSPNRDSNVTPRQLRKEVDAMPRKEVLSNYTIVESVDDYVDAYKPLIRSVHADIVVIQTTSVDQKAAIRLTGRKVLPELRKL